MQLPDNRNCQWEVMIHKQFNPNIPFNKTYGYRRYSDIYINFEILKEEYFIAKWLDSYIVSEEFPEIEDWYKAAKESREQWLKAGRLQKGGE